MFALGLALLYLGVAMVQEAIDELISGFNVSAPFNSVFGYLQPYATREAGSSSQTTQPTALVTSLLNGIPQITIGAAPASAGGSTQPQQSAPPAQGSSGLI